MEVIFEYAGSRRPLLVTRNGTLCNAIDRELEKFGCIEPSVAGLNLPPTLRPPAGVVSLSSVAQCQFSSRLEFA